MQTPNRMKYLCYKINEGVITVEMFENPYNRSDFMREKPEYLLIDTLKISGHPEKKPYILDERGDW